LWGKRKGGRKKVAARTITNVLGRKGKGKKKKENLKKQVVLAFRNILSTQWGGKKEDAARFSDRPQARWGKGKERKYREHVAAPFRLPLLRRKGEKGRRRPVVRLR